MAPALSRRKLSTGGAMLPLKTRTMPAGKDMVSSPVTFTRQLPGTGRGGSADAPGRTRRLGKRGSPPNPHPPRTPVPVGIAPFEVRVDILGEGGGHGERVLGAQHHGARTPRQPWGDKQAQSLDGTPTPRPPLQPPQDPPSAGWDTAKKPRSPRLAGAECEGPQLQEGEGLSERDCKARWHWGGGFLGLAPTMGVPQPSPAPPHRLCSHAPGRCCCLQPGRPPASSCGNGEGGPRAGPLGGSHWAGQGEHLRGAAGHKCRVRRDPPWQGSPRGAPTGSHQCHEFGRSQPCSQLSRGWVRPCTQLEGGRVKGKGG